MHSGEGHGEGDRHPNQLRRGVDRAPHSNAHGRQRLTSPENTVHLQVEAICATWRSKTYCVASLLMLDVKAAFDNFSDERLVHNLRKRCIQPRAISYMQSFLGGRSTIIRIPEGDSPSSGRTGTRLHLKLLQYAIAVCSMFAFPRTLLALPKQLGHINYCRISFP